MKTRKKTPKSFFIKVFGCQQNWHDADHISFFLRSLGLEEKEEKNADLRILLACSVRQHAVDRLHGLIYKWRQEENPPFIVILGCILEVDKKFFTKEGVYVEELKNFPKLLAQILERPNVEESQSCLFREPLLSKSHNRNLYFLPIIEGCNRFCTYCATAYTRGRQRSRPLQEVLEEIDLASKTQVKEVMFLGQIVTAYGRDLVPRTSFAELLSLVLKRPGNFQISFLSPYPSDFDDQLIEVLASSPRIKRVFHLPLQSGDDEILAKMNRGYTKKEYLDIVRKIKTKMPDAQLTTDIIVGFPGESEEQFQQTVDVCKQVGFVKAFIAQYSPRPGTYAFQHFKDDVPKIEKNRRFHLLDRLINKKES